MSAIASAAISQRVPAAQVVMKCTLIPQLSKRGVALAQHGWGAVGGRWGVAGARLEGVGARRCWWGAVARLGDDRCGLPGIAWAYAPQLKFQ